MTDETPPKRSAAAATEAIAQAHADDLKSLLTLMTAFGNTAPAPDQAGDEPEDEDD